jgi:hypothetical protein
MTDEDRTAEARACETLAWEARGRARDSFRYADQNEEMEARQDFEEFFGRKRNPEGIERVREIGRGYDRAAEYLENRVRKLRGDT